MKIVIIIGSFKTGGAERISINTGEELIRRGHDVYYIVQRPVFEIPNTIPPEKIIVLRKENRTDLFYKISALFLGVFRVTNKIKPDVVIAFSRFSSFLACFTFRKNIIARFDANPYRLSKKQRVWADIVLNNPFVKKVIVPSTGMFKELQKRRPDKIGKIFVIPNSIKQQSILVNADSSREYSFDYITAMGRLSHDKNFQLLINSFNESSVRDTHKLIIIGDGRQRKELDELVKKLSLEDRVIFTGRLANPFSVIANSSFFVNASLNEGFPNVILEALTLSRPVIATDCNYGPSDMIDSGENGFLVESDNLQELVSKINELGTNKELLQILEGKAYKSAKKYDIEQVGNEWEKLLKTYAN